MLADTSRAQALENREQLAIRQISALLYAMLIRRPSTLSTDFRLEALAPTTPMEFRVICKRGFLRRMCSRCRIRWQRLEAFRK